MEAMVCRIVTGMSLPPRSNLTKVLNPSHLFTIGVAVNKDAISKSYAYGSLFIKHKAFREVWCAIYK